MEVYVKLDFVCIFFFFWDKKQRLRGMKISLLYYLFHFTFNIV